MPLFVLLILLGPSLFAQTAGVDIKRPAKVKVVGPKKNTPPAPQPLVAPSQPVDARELIAETKKPVKVAPELAWAGAISYGLRTDLADKAKPRLYVHTLEVGYGFSHSPTQTSVGLGVGGAFQSLGDRESEINVNSNDAELFVSDVSMTLEKGWQLSEAYRLGLNFGNEFPTSPDARREGYNSVTSVALSLRSAYFNKRVAPTVSTGINYVWNSYRYSPATGDLNMQLGWRNTLALRVTVVGGWSISGSVGAQYSRYLDGTADRTYRSSIGTAYAWQKFSLSLSYSNGTYLSQEDATIWFIDQYRRTASFGMQFQF